MEVTNNMASIYYPTVTQVYTRVVGGTNLSELHIDTSPDTIFVITGSFPYTSSIVFIQAMDTSSSYPITASYTLTYLASSSVADFATTASYAGVALLSSYAATASVAQRMAPLMSVTSSISASFNPSSSIAQGNMILWLYPDSGSFHSAWGSIPVTTDGEMVRYMSDISGLGRHIYMHAGTSAAVSQKFSKVYNTGPNNNKTSIYCEYPQGGIFAYSAAFTTPTKPIWLFAVLRLPPGNTTTTCLFDGITSGTRLGIWAGTTPQIYCGSSYTGAITASHTSSILNNWFLQSFKYTGTTGCTIRTNGTQSLASGNAGTQSPTGYTLGSDSAGTGGGFSFLEMMVYSNITDGDAYNIESYLMAKNEIPASP